MDQENNVFIIDSTQHWLFICISSMTCSDTFVNEFSDVCHFYLQRKPRKTNQSDDEGIQLRSNKVYGISIYV